MTVEIVMHVIRPAKSAEADFLSALALRSKAHWGYSAAFLDACKDELSFTAEQIQSDGFNFFVAEADSMCIGFYALSRIYHAAGGVRSGRRESASIRGRFLPLFTIDLSTGDLV